MYKDKQKQKESNKLANQRYRKKVLPRPKVSRKGITDIEGITPLHPILEALIDPVKRAKLEAIYQSLKAHHVTEQISYGIPRAVRFDVVGELLECTQ